MKSLLSNVPSSDLHEPLLEAKHYILELELRQLRYNGDFIPEQLIEIGRMICSLWQAPEIRKAAKRNRALLSDDQFVAHDSLE